jgi:putative tryptophan/tyrosine transport system substrate-binding protein
MLEDTTMTRYTIGLIVTLALAILLAPVVADAQPSARVPRIGYLGNSSPSLEPDLVEAFRQGLRELGYIEGQTIVIEYRWAEGEYDRFPDLVADLIRLKVDVIVTAGTPGTLAAKQATKTIPIVMAVAGDAVGAGLVASLARPGGNVTGLTTIVQDLEGKRLELLKEVVPGLSRVGVLWNPVNPVNPIIFKQTQIAAQTLGLTVQTLDVRGVEEFEDAFAILARERPDALIMITDRFLLTHRKRIVEFMAQHRLPTMYPYRELVVEGGLLSYAPSYTDSFRRAATFVDKILKGTKPADLPVEQPMKFELVLNLKTAQALGLTIPPTLLFQADEVIR